MTTSHKIVYFYGFISSPLSTKAQYFKKQFKNQDIDLEILDLIPNAESFTNMRPSRLIKKIHTFVMMRDYEDITLMGSSFGGFLAAWYAARHHERIKNLILMAPALKFSAERAVKILGTTLTEWKERGSVSIPHVRFSKEVPLSYSFVEDLINHPPPDFSVLAAPIPTLIFHGKNDDVIPVKWSEDYASDRSNVSLNILESDHQLLDQLDAMWIDIGKFLEL
ncbi:MAG: YqiA/YcfP family alpha/beta fold hydrolase [Candidatus Hermodarchaeota archaeon]